MSLGIRAVRARPLISFLNAPSTGSSTNSIRSFSGSLRRKSFKHKPGDLPGLNEEDQGTFSRTDRDVRFDYPADKDVPEGIPVQGRSKRTLSTFSLEHRVVALTGGARGLGLVMAEALVVSGANVALIDLNYEEAQKQAFDMVERFRRENVDALRVPAVTAHRCDVADADAVDATVDQITKEHGQIDHLVTSAGFTENFDATAYPPDRMRKLWAVNVDGTYNFATAVARHLMARRARGSMVLVGSMSGAIVNVPQPQAPYNASKAAVRQLAASLAVEWAHAGIRVNCISPGYMLTALTKKVIEGNPQLQKQWTSLIPVGRMGSPEDLMGAVVYLLSDASSYTTGADLRVDGGYTVT